MTGRSVQEYELMLLDRVKVWPVRKNRRFPILSSMCLTHMVANLQHLHHWLTVRSSGNKIFRQAWPKLQTMLCCTSPKWYYTQKCEIKDPRNINNLIHMPEEALDIQYSLMAWCSYLPQEWNFGRQITLSSPATPLSPLTATHKANIPLTWRHTFIMLTYKIIAMCIGCATAL